MTQDCFTELRKRKNVSDRDLLTAASRILDTRKAGRSCVKNKNQTLVTGETVSDSIGCHPDQAAEFTETARAAGFTGVHFDKEGCCHLPHSGRQRKQFVKFYHEMTGVKIVDKSAGY